MRRGLLAVTLLLATACGAGTDGAAPAAILRIPVGGSPRRGPADAWVTVVEFADFQCPYCRVEEPVLRAVAETYGADLRIVFKHLPLTSLHQYARPAAIAAECAHDQGRFWELHDLLLLPTAALDPGSVRADAGQVSGLDLAAWQACVDAGATAARVDADLALATSLGIPGTPALVVNGTLLVGAVDESVLGGAVERARSAALRSGIPRDRYYDEAILGP